MFLQKRAVEIDFSRCRVCRFCSTVNICYSPDRCIGCLSCYYACLYGARRVVGTVEEVREVKIYIDGSEHMVPSGLTVAEALRRCGFAGDRDVVACINLFMKYSRCGGSGVPPNAPEPDEIPSGMRRKQYEAMTSAYMNLYQS